MLSPQQFEKVAQLAIMSRYVATLLISPTAAKRLKWHCRWQAALPPTFPNINPDMLPKKPEVANKNPCFW